MYCSSCGARIVDGSKFCSECGKPQTPNAKVSPRKVEVCQIREKFGSAGVIADFIADFIAGMVGINTSQDQWFEARVGDKVIAKSPVFKYRRSALSGGYRKGYIEDLERAKQVLVDQLISEGWEPIIADNGEINALRRES